MGVLGAAAVVGASGFASAEPPPDPPPQPPPLPNVNALAPVKLSDYAVMDGNWFAFTTPDGVICALQKGNGYGCSGAIPGAPDGANLVSGPYGGVPGFANTARPVFAVAGAARMNGLSIATMRVTVLRDFMGNLQTADDYLIDIVAAPFAGIAMAL